MQEESPLLSTTVDLFEHFRKFGRNSDRSSSLSGIVYYSPLCVAKLSLLIKHTLKNIYISFSTSWTNVFSFGASP